MKPKGKLEVERFPPIPATHVRILTRNVILIRSVPPVLEGHVPHVRHSVPVRHAIHAARHVHVLKYVLDNQDTLKTFLSAPLFLPPKKLGTVRVTV